MEDESLIYWLQKVVVVVAAAVDGENGRPTGQMGGSGGRRKVALA